MGPRCWGRALVAAGAIVCASCGDTDEVVSETNAATVSTTTSTVSPGTSVLVASDEGAGWTLTATPEADGNVCVDFRFLLGGGQNCGGDQSYNIANATIAPPEVVEQWEEHLGADLPADVTAFAFAYGSAPSDVDHVRLRTNRGETFQAETIAPPGFDRVFFIVKIPAEHAPLDMEVDAVEYARADATDDDGALVWTSSFGTSVG